ncbi:MAG: chalcone isomerase family protein [Janthinobacterium lividum]
MIRSSTPRLAAITALGSLAMLCQGEPAAAATKAGVTMPDTMEVAGKTLVLNGIGVRSFTMLHIRGYVGALYLPQKTTSATAALAEQGPKALFMQFVRGAPSDKVHDLYMDSSRNYCAKHNCTEADKTAFEKLLGTVQSVKPGDRTGFIVTDSGVQVLFNGKQITTIDDPKFGHTIIDSDLGSTSPSAELRDGLLGKTDS